jgi:hypothetical protein
VPPLHVEIFGFEKNYTIKSRFLVVFQSFVFGQILANLGSFGQFWSDFAIEAVANSMPKLGLNS